MKNTFLLYGANGYTGQLILDYLAPTGLRPILAGRSEEKIRPLAEKHGLDYRVADLGDPDQLDGILEDVPVVLHAAGPFIRTARPMLESCLRTRTHYLDITGEIAVFELAATYGPRARDAGIMVMPGVGFDVVPTDCMAVYLKGKLPDATHLQLAFAGLGGGVSHGTAKTMVESLGEPGAIRLKGEIVAVPVGYKTLWVPFQERELFTMTIPWGDVSTAFYSTGIPNIETYMSISPKAYGLIKRQQYFTWLLRRTWVRSLFQLIIDRRPAGPSPQQRAGARGLVWGKVTNAEGHTFAARYSGPDGYTLTALSSLLITGKVLNGEAPTGFQTPAKAYGSGLVMELPDTYREDLGI